MTFIQHECLQLLNRVGDVFEGSRFKDIPPRGKERNLMKKFLSILLAAMLCMLSVAALAEGATVYMTTDLSPEGLVKIYEALGFEAHGNVAVKMHLGEPGNDYYLHADFVEPLVTKLGASFVESNTYFGGDRMETAAHLQIAADHGFTYAPVDIMDADGDMTIPMTCTDTPLTEAIVGKNLANYDSIVSIAHYKGHGIAGIGGTFKNVGMGMASKYGKSKIHNEADDQPFSTWGEPFERKLVGYAAAIINYKGAENVVYINVLNNLSVSCDCESVGSLGHDPKEPTIADIGILASTDPVALEKASFDLVAAAEGSEEFVAQAEAMGGTLQFVIGEEYGLGTQTYEIVSID